MKHDDIRREPPVGRGRAFAAWTGICGANAGLEIEGSSPSRVRVISNIGLPKKAAPQGEGGGPLPRLMNIRQLSGYLAMPVATIYTWVCLRRVPASCIVRLGRSLRFDREAVDRWIEERRIGP